MQNKLLLITIIFFCSRLFAMEVPEQQKIAWGISERQGIRNSMEDFYAQGELRLVPWANPGHYFALFDGHGGAGAAELASQIALTSFSKAYSDSLAKSPEVSIAINQAFIHSYDDMDKQIQEKYFLEGTTVISALILENELTIAWAGDCRAILIGADGSIKARTIDHKPGLFEEKKRIIGLGEKISQSQGTQRVGTLAISRALGDKREKTVTKKGAIIATPEVIKAPIAKGDLLVLACDGVWDVMQNDQVAEFLTANGKLSLEELQKKFENSQNLTEREKLTQKEAGNNQKMIFLARILRNHAYIRKSLDNISVMIIQIQ